MTQARVTFGFSAALAAAALSITACSRPSTPPSGQPKPPQGLALAARSVMLKVLMNKPLTVNALHGGVYWVSGGVSNTGFIIGDTGVIAIDPQMFPQTAKREQAEIAKLTPKPVNAVIITHSDPDHINGLPGWPLGVQVIAQENAKTEIQGFLADPNSNGVPPPPELKSYVPTKTVRFSENVVIDGVRMTLMHVAAAHTDGDLMIYLPDQKIVFAGDILAPAIGDYPGLHLEKHGSSLGWIKSMQAILALDADTYVSGHGAVLDKAAVQALLQTGITRRAEIKALFDQGKTLGEIKAALHDKPLTGEAAMFPTYIETTYKELTYQ